MSDDGGAQSVQEVYRVMMRDHVAPSIRKLGFKGSSGRFFYSARDWVGHIDMQKSTGSTKSSVDFTFNLNVVHSPSITGPRTGIIWGSRLGPLTRLRTDYWWKLRPGMDAYQLFGSVNTVLRDCGWTAIEAVMQIATPPGECVRPPKYVAAGGSRVDPITFLEQQSKKTEYLDNCPIEEVFEWSASADDNDRFMAMWAMFRRAPQDSRTSKRFSQMLLDDESWRVRQNAALFLAHLRNFAELDVAIESVKGDEEEIFQVRCAASYALLCRSRVDPD